MKSGNFNSAIDLSAEEAGGLSLRPIKIASSKIDGWLSVGGLSLSILLAAYHLLGFGLHGTLALLTVAFSLFTTIYFGLALRKGQPWRAVLEITPKGVLYRHFSATVIEWSLIEHISVLQLASVKPAWRLDIRLCSDADPALVEKATYNWAAITHAPGKPNVSISNIQFENYTYAEVASLLTQYHRAFR